MDGKKFMEAIQELIAQKDSAIKEINDLKVEIWKLEKQLNEAKAETEEWKRIAFEAKK